MANVIAHIDLNQFFVRCEEIKNPSLVGKAVIVGGTGRGGIVSTCSYETRKKGVHSGMPTYVALRLCPEAIVLPVDYKYYSLMSREFFNYISHYCKKIEKASVDECFLDLTETLSKVKNPKQYLLDMQSGLFKTTGLKCSIGVAPTKFLAKMASDLKKPMGLVILHRKDFKKYIYPLAVKETYGIGKKTAPELEKEGIKTIGELAQRIENDDPTVVRILGKFIFVIKDWLNGYGSDEVETESPDPKSIGTSTTLETDTNNFDEVSGVIRELCQRVVSDLKKENKRTHTIQIVVKDTSFHIHNKSFTFKEPTNNLNIIYSKALSLYEKNFTEILIRLVGVTLQNLIDEKDIAVQMDLFNYDDYQDENETKALIDELNRKFNKSVFIRASEVKKK